MEIYGINLLPLLKAFSKFESFRQNLNSEQEKAGAIQAFEYTFELCWKSLKKVLGERGIVANSPRESFRLAAMEGLLEDAEVWFAFLRLRNLTSHTYEENEAEIVIRAFPDFSNEVKFLLSNLEKLC